jgi:hypothetical protein
VVRRGRCGVSVDETPSDEIHLWLASYDDARCRALYPAYRAMLSDAEKQQEGQLHFARDRNGYLLTRLWSARFCRAIYPLQPQTGRSPSTSMVGRASRIRRRSLHDCRSTCRTLMV